MPENAHFEDDAPIHRQWPLQPGLTAEAIVRILFFVLVWEAGILWRFSASGAGPRGIVSLAPWSPVIVAASFLLAGPAASAVLGLLSRTGIFGTAAIRGRRLYLGRKTSFALGKDLRLEGRKHTTLIERSLRLPFRDRHLPAPSSEDAPPDEIFAAVLRLEENGRTATVYAVCPERKKKAFPPEGVDLHDRPVGLPRGRRARLSVRDLTELHGRIREIAGDDIQSVTTLSRDSASAGKDPDPRTLFRNRAAVAAAAVLIVGAASVLPAVKIAGFEPAAGTAAAADASSPSAEVTARMKQARRGDPLWRITVIGELGLMGKDAAPALPLLRELAAKDKEPRIREAASRAAAKIEAALERP